jgi:Domain of unknown function (DUF4062)
MIPKKKLQVFVSSTYVDLKAERQAAVEAILSAGHIPAGMELFAAGDRSQMEVIKRWIDESDAFLLILGGRYGSLEPTANKSYVELEYEYAQEKGKAFFAVVIDENYLESKVKVHGSEMLEKENPQHLKTFRAKVLTKLVKFFGDSRDIELAVHKTLSDFSRRDELIGWIPGNQAVNSGALAEEIARLAKENTTLRDRLSKTGDATPTFCGLTFHDMYQMLRNELIDLSIVERDFEKEAVDELESDVAMFKDSKPSLLHLLWLCRDALASEYSFSEQEELLDRLRGFGLVEITERSKAERSGHSGIMMTMTPAFVSYGLTDDGRQFLLRLRLELSRQAGVGENPLATPKPPKPSRRA